MKKTELVKLLKYLKGYFTSNRQVGHTSAVLYGAINTPKTLIVAPESGTKQKIVNILKALNKPGVGVDQVITLQDIHNGFRGRSSGAPLVFDNGALYQLVNNVLDVLKEETASTPASNTSNTLIPEIKAMKDKADTDLNLKNNATTEERIKISYKFGFYNALEAVLSSLESRTPVFKTLSANVD